MFVYVTAELLQFFLVYFFESFSLPISISILRRKKCRVEGVVRVRLTDGAAPNTKNGHLLEIVQTVNVCSFACFYAHGHVFCVRVFTKHADMHVFKHVCMWK